MTPGSETKTRQALTGKRYTLLFVPDKTIQYCFDNNSVTSNVTVDCCRNEARVTVKALDNTIKPFLSSELFVHPGSAGATYYK